MSEFKLFNFLLPHVKTQNPFICKYFSFLKFHCGVLLFHTVSFIVDPDWLLASYDVRYSAGMSRC